jgi:hypothetical protein
VIGRFKAEKDLVCMYGSHSSKLLQPPSLSGEGQAIRVEILGTFRRSVEGNNFTGEPGKSTSQYEAYVRLSCHNSSLKPNEALGLVVQMELLLVIQNTKPDKDSLRSPGRSTLCLMPAIKGHISSFPASRKCVGAL